jgi:SAM-dependent methyltransferase
MPASYTAIPIAGGDTATPRNLAKRLAQIRRWAAAGCLLDAGCGAGEYVVALEQYGYDVRGIEYLGEKVAQWQAAHPGDPRVQQGDLARLPFPDAAFDAVLVNEVLEHVPDERAVLAELRRVLRPGGVLLVFSPNRRFPFETHGVDRRRSGQRIPPRRTFGLPWLPLTLTVKLVHPWARNYWPGELEHLVASANFRIVAHDYVWQTLENISGTQGSVLRGLAPLLRALFAVAERTPGLRTLGASQLIVARVPVPSPST